MENYEVTTQNFPQHTLKLFWVNCIVVWWKISLQPWLMLQWPLCGNQMNLVSLMTLSEMVLTPSTLCTYKASCMFCIFKGFNKYSKHCTLDITLHSVDTYFPTSKTLKVLPYAPKKQAVCFVFLRDLTNIPNSAPLI